MAKKRKPEIEPFRTTDKHNRFNEDGREILNPTPMQPPIGYKKQPSIAEQIREQVRAAKYLDDMEPETEEEADDFEIDDDPPIPSRWENDMVPSIKETRARIRALQEQEKMFAKTPTPEDNPKRVPSETESKS